jgi:signal transduction histidine kinase/ActR/RegA family two-component response regulator
MQRAETIRAEQIRLLYANAPFGFVATVLNVVLLALIQWQVMASPIILAWLASMLVLTTLRAVLVWRFQRNAPAPHAIGRWGMLFDLGTFGAGIGWGSAGVWLFPVASITHQVFLAFVLGGMIAGAVGLLSARMSAYLSFATPAALPVIVRLLAQGDGLSRTMGGMAALFTIVIVFTAWKLHCTIRTSLHLRFDNADLVAAVTTEKERVEHLNTELTAEITERRRAEDALQTAHEALAVRIQERTAELATTLEQLQAEMEERQQLAAQLRQSQHMEAIGRLAGGVAHDFNNILAAMIGYTELAMYDMPASSPVWSHLQEVLKAGQRAKALVHQILTFSRRTEREHTPVHLPLLVQESLSLLRASLPSTMEIRQHIAPEAGTVLADTTQLHQVVLNLCANAEYAMRQTGGILEVRLEVVDIDTALVAQYPTLRPGPYVRLMVQDTGHGMPPDVVERIYEPFFTTKAVGEGTGIGLSVVHGIVVDHGGTITVESQVGYGTTFTIYLPRIECDMAGAAQEEEAMPHGQGRILFVDDEAALVHLGHTVLTQLGYSVAAYTSSEEALAVFQAAPHHFDLVITDYTMPHITGEALARSLRSIRPDIPIILGTGFSYTTDAEKARALGINAFLMKPWTAPELARTIAQVLAQHRA